ncbi:MAG: long-chain fatty acid--CoA ligase [Betaproteobacteria bacterium]|nr:long-chain fatty acid--CoA ligase [Betaproteobacteria bacterium]
MDHVISVEAAGTLDGLFRERVKRTPTHVAYRDYNHQQSNWRDYTWEQMYREIARWQAALAADGLQAGDRVGVMLRNSPEWVLFDQAAMGLGLVVVPLYTQDRPDNVAYILNDSNCKVLLFGTNEQWAMFKDVRDQLGGLLRILIVEALDGAVDDARVKSVEQWLPAQAGDVKHVARNGNDLATIVYTSGTTGRPKGVMLSHNNILTNSFAALQVLTVTPEDSFLSFLPLSHTFERTCGYYLTIMCDATVAYSRGIPQLAEDLQSIRPTMLISVPRIYERIWGAIRAKLDEGPPLRKKLFLAAVDVGFARFEHAQGRGPWKLSFLFWPILNKLVASKVLERLGGRMKAAMSGGAALPADISRVFIGLGLRVLQGYGLTETSPIACANSPEDNLPASVGKPVPGVQVKLGENNALLIKGPNIMMGYWNNEVATKAMIQSDGWLNSGDTARIDEKGHVFITGRIKEIIVLSNGEKMPPVDMENAILQDPLFEQVMLLGEAKPYLSLIAVLNGDQWNKLAGEKGWKAEDAATLRDNGVKELITQRVGAQLKAFPGYAQVRQVTLTLEPWSVENGMLTPTLKLKRPKVMEKFNAEIDGMYAGH